MATQGRNTLKGWFLTGKYPTQSQFADWIDSFWHKSEDSIPQAKIESLAESLALKADLEYVDNIVGGSITAVIAENATTNIEVGTDVDELIQMRYKFKRSGNNVATGTIEIAITAAGVFISETQPRISYGDYETTNDVAIAFQASLNVDKIELEVSLNAGDAGEIKLFQIVKN